MNKTLATAVLGISPEMQLLELIDQAGRCQTDLQEGRHFHGYL